MITKNQFYEGQWVKYRFHPQLKEQKGYIVGFFGDAAEVQPTGSKKTVPVPLRHIKPYEEEHNEDDLTSLLDIALLLNDIEWAKEIHAKLEDLKNGNDRNE